jgi:hypothetical protein
MSLRKVSLRKALKLFGLPENKLISALRDDIRTEMRKQDSDDSGGGDFHIGFWRDAKDHATHKFDLTAATLIRIDSNKGRQRLYPALRVGFLQWWDEFRRLSNEDFEEIEESIHGRYPVPGANAFIKVENVLALKIGGITTRIIYPYFSEQPMLSDESARMGLWLMAKTLPGFDVADMVLLDVLRSKGYSINDVPLKGDEESKFLDRFNSILLRWVTLAREEYDWAA